MNRLALLVVALGLTPAAAAAPAAVVTEAVQPSTVRFGDSFQYVVEARAPRGAGDVRVFADGGVFDQIRAPSVQRSTQGDEVVVRVVQTLACLARGCVPEGASRRVDLPAPRVVVGGGVVRGHAVTVMLLPRVPAKAVAAASAPYLRQTAVPRPAPGLPFGVAVALAIAAAVALAGASAALVMVELRRRDAARHGADTVLARLPLALRLLRESASRPIPDRRRAADYVARAVRSTGNEPVSEDATRVAWAPPDPSPHDVTGLADEVERATGAGR